MSTQGKQTGDQMGSMVLRDEKGRLLKGTKSPGRPWKPGESGNPRGRQLEARLKDYLSEGDTSERMMETLARIALDPTHPAWIKAVQVVLDRADGAVAKSLKLEGELPLKVLVKGSRDSSD